MLSAGGGNSRAMSKITWWRVLGCGLLAGIVWIILGSLVTSLLGREFAALPNNHLRAPTPSFLVVNVVLDLLEGISILWLYAAIRPLYGPGAKNRWHRGIRVVVYRQPGRRHLVLLRFLSAAHSCPADDRDPDRQCGSYAGQPLLDL
jgi:hypothetical protein